MIALFSALIAPHFVDWTAHKQKFESQASEIFGQRVRVEGDASVILLPVPSVRFGKMTVGENEDGSPLLFADEFSANIEIIPFLSGEVRVVDLTLDKPILNIHVDEHGSIQWTKRQNASQGQLDNFVDFEQVQLDRVNITNAQINIKGLAGGRNFYGENINGQMSAKSLYGPYDLKALGVIEGVETQFEISTGRIQDDGKLRLKVSAQRLDQPYKILLDGPIGVEEDVLAWAGKFKISPVSAQADTSSKFLSDNIKEPLPVRTDGLFSLTPAALSVSEFRTEIGDKIDPFVLEGTGSATLKDDVYFRFNIDGRQINLDRVAQMRGEEVSETNKQTSADRIRIIREVIEQVPVPSFSGELDFEVPAIIAGDSIIREVSANIRPRAKGWEFRRLRAKMPGSSTLEAEGRLGLFEDFGFSGHMVLATKQPSGLASWAVGRVDPAIRGLSSAGLEADVTFTQSQTSFENMILLLDNNQLKGNVQRIAGFDGGGDPTKVSRPAIIAKLEGDEIRLEDLQAVMAFTGQDESQKINEHDLDVNLLAKGFEAFDVAAKDVDLQFQIAAGELSIGKLNAASFYGSTITSEGQISDLLGKPKGNIKFNLAAQDASQIVTFVQNRLGNHFILEALQRDDAFTSDTNLSVEIDASPSGEGSRGRVIIDGKMGGTDVDALMSFDASIESLNDAKLDLSLNLQNPAPKVLLGQTGLLTKANDADVLQLREPLAGPIKMTVESVGTINAGLSTLVSATTEQASMSANGLYSPSNTKDEPIVEMDLTFGFENVEPYLFEFGYDLFHSINSGVAIFGAGESVPLSLKTKMALDEDKANFTNLSATVSGNSLKGDLVWRKKSNGNSLVEGELSIDQLSVPKMAGFVFGKNGAGGVTVEENDSILKEASKWSKAEFGSPLFERIDANINIVTAELFAGSKFTTKDAKLALSMRDGNIALKNIIGESENGTFSGDISLQNADGTGVLKGFFQVDGLSGKETLAKFGLPDFLDGKIELNGAFESSGKTALAMVSALSGSGVISIQEGVLKGVNTNGLSSVLAASDIEEFEIKDETVNPLIEESFLKGQMNLGDESIAYTISRGVAQVRNLIIEGDAWQGAMEGEGSLIDNSFTSNMRLGVDGGKDSVAGVSPEIAISFKGQIDDEGSARFERTIDSQTMQGFLSVRALEAEERRVELLQAAILEKQRHRFESLKSSTKNQYVEFQKQEEQRFEIERKEALRLAREEAQRQKALKEAAAKKAAEEAAKAAQVKAKRVAAAKAAAEAKKIEDARIAAEKARKVAETKAAKQKAAAAAETKKAAEEARRASDIEQKAEPEILKPIEVPPLDTNLLNNRDAEKSAIELIFPKNQF